MTRNVTDVTSTGLPQATKATNKNIAKLHKFLKNESKNRRTTK